MNCDCRATTAIWFDEKGLLYWRRLHGRHSFCYESFCFCLYTSFHIRRALRCRVECLKFLFVLQNPHRFFWSFPPQSSISDRSSTIDKQMQKLLLTIEHSFSFLMLLFMLKNFFPLNEDSTSLVSTNTT